MLTQQDSFQRLLAAAYPPMDTRAKQIERLLQQLSALMVDGQPVGAFAAVVRQPDGTYNVACLSNVCPKGREAFQQTVNMMMGA